MGNLSEFVLVRICGGLKHFDVFKLMSLLNGVIRTVKMIIVPLKSLILLACHILKCFLHCPDVQISTREFCR